LANLENRKEKMTEPEQMRSEARAQILKALAHPSRIFIVDKLSEQSHSVFKLTEMIGADTSTVSKHLSILKNAGIISARNSMSPSFYRVRGAGDRAEHPEAARQPPREIVGKPSDRERCAMEGPSQTTPVIHSD
jgi:ArsR family transcriptional regulator